ALVVRPIAGFIAEQGKVSGDVPLTPIQSAFFGWPLQHPQHFNQAFLLRVPSGIRPDVLRETLKILTAHHDALNLRYAVDPETSEWKQAHTPDDDEPPFFFEDLRNSGDPDNRVGSKHRHQTLEKRLNFWQASLNLEKGPLQRMVLFRLDEEYGPDQSDGSDGNYRLFWCIHHLVVDGVSWRILLEDLQRIYKRIDQGKNDDISEDRLLPPKTTSYKAWAQRLQAWQDEDSFTKDAVFWHHLKQMPSLPVDFPEGSNRLAHMRDLKVQLPETWTHRLLKETPAAFGTRISDLLLTSLLRVLENWTGRTQHLIDLESHGRTDMFLEIDVSRTVGWFTSLYTMMLALPAAGTAASPGEALKSVKEQLRTLPNEGIGYGVLRHIAGETLPRGQILFNYLGQFDRIPGENGWAFATESTGDEVNLNGGEREHLIAVNAITINGCLNLTWSYSKSQYRQETIEKLANGFLNQLKQLIRHCSSHFGRTPSDFPLAALDQEQIDRLTGSYGNNIETIYPLSPMQQGMMFHALYDDEGDAYITQMNQVLEGHVDPDAFRRSWEILLTRHPALRTAFLSDEDAPLQLVYKKADLPWQFLDWTGLAGSEKHRKLDALLKAERQRGFDLARAPLMRMQLIREGETRFRFVWHHHHLITDGWCLSILFSELRAIYRNPSADLPLPYPYQSYIAWLKQQDQQAARGYWQTQLKGVTSPTRLPQLRTGTPHQSGYQETWLSLEQDLGLRIDRFCRRNHLTRNTLFQGAWALLLSRYSREETVIFGVTTSGRQAPVAGIEKMVGLFINTVPLRVCTGTSGTSGTSGLISFLKAIQHRQQKNDTHAHVSLADIQGWSDIPKGTALFDTLLVFENYPVDDTGKHEDTFTFADEGGITVHTNYPISLAVIPEDQIRLKLTFDRGKLDTEDMEQMLVHLKHLLSEMIENPEAQIHKISLLSEPEHRQLVALGTSDDTSDKIPDESPVDNRTITDLFHDQVEKTPDLAALSFHGTGQPAQTLSYRQLNAKANQLSHHLIRMGVGPETLAGICVNRSPEMVIAMLAVLKAGGAYIPLDPDYPESRLQFIMADSGVSVLITQNHMPERLTLSSLNQSDTSFQTICLDRDRERIAACTTENPEQRIDSGNLAYMIYTSGSTGQPKGSLISHRGVVNYLGYIGDRYGLGPGDTALQLTPMSFDPSVRDILGPLTRGARVLLVSGDSVAQPDVLLSLMNTCRVTIILSIVPALLQAIVETGMAKTDRVETDVAEGNYDSLRAILTCGEALPLELARDAVTLFGSQVQVVNQYGPTECTMSTTYHPVDTTSPERIADGQAAGGIALIGAPIPNTRVYVLDEMLNPVPVGVPGELHIGGTGVGRGYCNRPGLTAEKFIPHPYGEKGERLYKTGDLVRWVHSETGDRSQLEFIGRLDHQVKLRGMRIEPEEIESVLRRHEGVTHAAAVLRGKDMEARLVAYVTLNRKVENVETVLHTWMHDRLPAHMLPSDTIVLDRMPLTPNGKIDRNNLPAPKPRKQNQPEYPGQETPLTETERLLIALWSRVLNTKINDKTADFFQAGGHSLLATRLVSRIRRCFSVEMPIRTIFRRPTIEGQARWINQALRTGKPETMSLLPPISAMDEEKSPVLSFAQERLWFLTQLEQQGNNYNIPAMLSLEGKVNHRAMQETMAAIVRRHISLRMRFPTVDGNATVRILAPYDPLTVTDLGDLSPEEQRRQTEALVNTHFHHKFDLETGPLFSLHLIRLSKRRHLLLLNMHH
ncbi:MAG: amino acid adenylation domain-containing protein, partial [Desulfobacterales bacterium]|nr:amino acid adenylation domain-containing protein [Desulfobacterales bacterium]